MSVTKAKAKLESLRQQQTEQRSLLARLKKDAATQRLEIDEAKNEARRKQRTRVYQAMCESISACERDIERLSEAIAAAEDRLAAARADAPNAKVQRDRAEEICKELAKLAGPGDRAFEALLAWHSTTIKLFAELASIVGNADDIIGRHQIHELLTEHVWARLGTALGEPAPYRKKRPTLKELMATGRCALSRLERLEDAA